MTAAAVQSAAFAPASGGSLPRSVVDALMASSLTGGVLNTRELAGRLSTLAQSDPQGAQALHEAVSARLGPVDQQRLTADRGGKSAETAGAPAPTGLAALGAPAVAGVKVLADAKPKLHTPGVDDFKLVGATAQDRADLKTSVDYLDDTKLGAQVVKQAEMDGVTIHIIHDGNDRANGKEVWWDPKSALVTTKGGVQSPALGLVHELAHTQANPKTPVKPLNNAYDNTEERRVITRIETPIARQLGEGIRTDHRGDLLTVKDPTYHKPNPAK